MHVTLIPAEETTNVVACADAAMYNFQLENGTHQINELSGARCDVEECSAAVENAGQTPGYCSSRRVVRPPRQQLSFGGSIFL
jgi:hypothetical protein